MYYTIKILDDDVAEADLPAVLSGSFFGHDPNLNVIAPPWHDLPAQIVLTLDNGLPEMATLGIDVGPKVRLVHPFRYSQGQTFAYHHQPDGTIAFIEHSDRIELIDMSEIHRAHGLEPEPWPHAGFTDVFPTRRIELSSATPDQRRKPDDCTTIHFGTNVATAQNYDGTTCIACTGANPRVIASVPSRPAPGLDIWNNNYVFAVFWFCPTCKAIMTHNECD